MKNKILLERFYNTDNDYEICIDEAGRGCLMGRVYIASVILPKQPEYFDGTDIKDSKKFSSKKKLKTVANYIKENALSYNISYIDANTIDDINILKATVKGMHMCIKDSLTDIKEICEENKEDISNKNIQAVIDGNYFKPYMYFDENKQSLTELPHTTIEQGDGKYMGIAAASILAKDARDTYIQELCETYPILTEWYCLNKNMGYGTKHHLEGINNYGITQWHRKTYSCCKNKKINFIEEKSI